MGLGLAPRMDSPASRGPGLVGSPAHRGPRRDRFRDRSGAAPFVSSAPLALGSSTRSPAEARRAAHPTPPPSQREPLTKLQPLNQRFLPRRRLRRPPALRSHAIRGPEPLPLDRPHSLGTPDAPPAVLPGPGRPPLVRESAVGAGAETLAPYDPTGRVWGWGRDRLYGTIIRPEARGGGVNRGGWSRGIPPLCKPLILSKPSVTYPFPVKIPSHTPTERVTRKRKTGAPRYGDSWGGPVEGVRCLPRPAFTVARLLCTRTRVASARRFNLRRAEAQT